MFTLFSSLLFRRDVLDSQLLDFGFTHVESANSNNFLLISYRKQPEITALLKSPISLISNTWCSCSTHPGQNTSIEFCDDMTSTYLKQGRPRRDFKFSKLQVSCILFDEFQSNLWLVGDSVGSNPMWFSFSLHFEQSGHSAPFIATTDAFAARSLGFSQLNSLGPCNMMSIDFLTMEIVDLFDQCESPVSSQRATTPDTYMKRMLAASMRALKPIVLSNVEMEFDQSDSASLLLHCTAQAANLTWTSRTLAPFVSNSDTFIMSAGYHRIEKYLVDFRDLSTNIWEPRFDRIVQARWQFCDGVQRHGDLGAIVSFDVGLFPRPLHVYLQNIFCAVVGAKLIYPYSDLNFQQVLHLSEFPESALYRSIDLMKATGSCDVPIHRTRQVEKIQECDDLVVDKTAGLQNRFCMSPQVTRHIELTPRPTDQPADTVTSTKHDMEGQPPYPSTNRHLGKLWLEADRFASEDGFIVVVLATSGFAEMLANFLCSMQQMHKHLLVISPNDDILALTSAAKVGSFSPDPQYTELMRRRNGIDVQSISTFSSGFADFGTLSYQELMLFRTEIVMDLLLMGFRPIIADIDTVWLGDPLAIVRDQSEFTGKSYDLLVTDDNGEVCGCFVALNNTESAINLWQTVLDQHRSLVYEGYKQSGRLGNFSDSEQKILTNLIVKRGYAGKLDVNILPRSLFPSGFQFFNLHSSFLAGDEPAIVHNNFLIGRDTKVSRFMRYGLWRVDAHKDRDDSSNSSSNSKSSNNSSNNSTSNSSNSNSFNSGAKNVPVSRSLIGKDGMLQCDFDPLQNWNILFTATNKDVSMPSLSVVLPVHDTVVSGRLMLVQIITEGLQQEQSAARVFVENDPPSSIAFLALGVYDLSIHTNDTVMATTALLENSNIAVHVDYGINKTSFSFDRGGRHHDEANERVLLYRRTFPEEVPVYHRPETLKPRPILNINNNSVNEASSFRLWYSIKVLAFNRPDSLLRLLRSLASAEYLGYRVSLEIFIDGNRTDEEGLLVEKVVTVADDFIWPTGDKRVVRRQHNQGLAKQWFQAWDPRSNSEAAFIFEDDIEVSSLFFVWSHSAARKYYEASVTQRELHLNLLNATRAHIRTQGMPIFDNAPNGTEDTEQPSASASHEEGGQHHLFASYLDKFARDSAGEPLIFGICLQKQHLDAAHYPQRLDIRNGHRPFLYSLIGSWGPLFLPCFWQAFREWWAWRSLYAKARDLFEPMTETLVVNYFYKKNPTIWTPWITRYAYETGAKCLYSNLPSDLAYISNFREGGENYNSTLGAETRLLTRELVDLAYARHEQGRANYSLNNGLHANGGFVDGEWALQQEEYELLATVHSAHTYLPPIEVLARWEFDFNIRRAGSLGIDKLHHFSERQQEGNMESQVANSSVPELTLVTTFHKIASAWSRLTSAHATRLSDNHMVLAVDMLEAYLLPGAKLVHLAASQLLPVLLTRFPSHRLLLPRHDVHHLSRRHSSYAPEPGLDETGDINVIRNGGNQFVTCVQLVAALRSTLASAAFDAYISDWPCMQFHHSEVHKMSEAMAFGEGVTVIVDAVNVVDGGFNSSLSALFSRLGLPQYLLVLGTCTSAPTDVTVKYYHGKQNLFADSVNSTPHEAGEKSGTKDGGKSLGESSDPLTQYRSSPGRYAHYSLVEDVCREGGDDGGVTLFKLFDVTQDGNWARSRVLIQWRHTRHAVSRRFQGGIVSRRTIAKKSLSIFA